VIWAAVTPVYVHHPVGDVSCRSSAGPMAALAIFGVRHAGWRPLPELLRFGLGDYLGFTVLGAALAVATRPEPLQSAIAGVVFVVTFGALLRATARQPDGRGVNARLATVAMEDT